MGRYAAADLAHRLSHDEFGLGGDVLRGTCLGALRPGARRQLSGQAALASGDGGGDRFRSGWPVGLRSGAARCRCWKKRARRARLRGRLRPCSNGSSRRLARILRRGRRLRKTLPRTCWGLGNAATPAGLRAMRLLREEERAGDAATDAMCMFLVLNASSLQLFPSTVDRAARGGGGGKSRVDCASDALRDGGFNAYGRPGVRGAGAEGRPVSAGDCDRSGAAASGGAGGRFPARAGIRRVSAQARGRG